MDVFNAIFHFMALAAFAFLGFFIRDLLLIRDFFQKSVLEKPLILPKSAFFALLAKSLGLSFRIKGKRIQESQVFSPKASLDAIKEDAEEGEELLLDLDNKEITLFLKNQESKRLSRLEKLLFPE